MSETAWTPWERLLNWIAPRRCAACGEGALQGELFCSPCRPALQLRRNAIDDVPAFSLGAHDGALRQAIARYKFERRAELALPLARNLFSHCAAAIQAEAARSACAQRACLVPVPLHPKRLAERGFNQSALLAKHFAQWSNMRCAPRALQRKKYTQQQARLNRAARQENLRWQVQVRHLPAAAPIVLVDDVITTGSTARACITAVRSAGSEVLAILALAHTP